MTDLIAPANPFDYGALDDDAATFVRDRTAAIKGRIGRLTFDIVETGQDLINVKDRLGHGRFLDWLSAEFSWTKRTAQRFMRVAEAFKSDTVSLLPIAPTGLYALSEPGFPPDVRDELIARAEAGETISASDVAEARALYRKPQPVTNPPPFPTGRYRCLVIDPPWPMERIEREERPAQAVYLDYPIMTLDEIAALPIPSLAEPDGCHVYLWVTQRFLPDGLALFKAWGVAYQCVLTWLKPGGPTPFSWMYNTEHVLFGRIGALALDVLGLKLGFSAPAVGHSVKPDVFYERVLAVSPGARLDLFARRPRTGFEVWGNDVVDTMARTH